MREMRHWRGVVDEALKRRLVKQKQLMVQLVTLAKEAEGIACEQEKIRANVRALERSGARTARHVSYEKTNLSDDYRTAESCGADEADLSTSSDVSEDEMSALIAGGGGRTRERPRTARHERDLSPEDDSSFSSSVSTRTTLTMLLEDPKARKAGGGGAKQHRREDHSSDMHDLKRVYSWMK